MTRPNTADSRDTNVKYIAAVAKILHANAEATAEGWTEVGLLVNKAPGSQKVSTYAALERGSEHFDDWLTPSAWDELGKVLAKGTEASLAGKTGEHDPSTTAIIDYLKS